MLLFTFFSFFFFLQILTNVQQEFTTAMHWLIVTTIQALLSVNAGKATMVMDCLAAHSVSEHLP